MGFSDNSLCGKQPTADQRVRKVENANGYEENIQNQFLAHAALIAIGIAVSSSEVDLHTECGRLADKWLMPKLHSPAGKDFKRH